MKNYFLTQTLLEVQTQHERTSSYSMRHGLEKKESRKLSCKG